MSPHAPRPCFAAMPPELLSKMVPQPGYTCSTSIWPLPPWLAISTRQYDKRDYYGRNAELKETLLTLRSLSRTCRSLRAFTMHILWAECHISNAAELPRLRETLRVTPHIASYVRSFHVLCAVPNSSECIIEIVSQLSSLKTFTWATDCTTMPRATFNALGNLATLKRLHIDLQVQRPRRDSFQLLPYWQISGNLEELSLDLGDREPPYSGTVIGEQDELQLTELDTSAQLCIEHEDLAALLMSTACRTIIAAARGGQLDSLTIKGLHVEPPFAIRQLLPCWVRMKHWHSGAHEAEWARAAEQLRPLLAHASLWHGVDSSLTPRDEREFTGKDIQALRSGFKIAGMPHLYGPEHIPRVPLAVERYFLWLEEDEELAKQVADAWNAVLKQGQTDAPCCYCARCLRVRDLERERERLRRGWGCRRKSST